MLHNGAGDKWPNTNEYIYRPFVPGGGGGTQDFK